MNRITNDDIDRRIEYLNDITDNYQAPYELVDGKLKHMVGCYYRSGAYGGVRLEQICVGGGARDISPHGYGTKRQLYDFLNAYIKGIELGKELINHEI